MSRRLKATAAIVALALAASACLPHDAEGVGLWAANESDERLILRVRDVGDATPRVFRIHGQTDLRSVDFITVGASGSRVLVEVLREADCARWFTTELEPGDYQITVRSGGDVEVGAFPSPGRGPTDLPGLARAWECLP